MSFALLLEVVAVCALLPAALFLWNIFLYREPPAKQRGSAARPSISVLIPARNEERSIAAAVQSVLDSQNVDFEIIVLDDCSTDRTALIVAQISAQTIAARTIAADDRTKTIVRIESAPKLPPGWNGKQHACFVLASLARFDTFCFLDADVRLQPQALARMAAFLDSSRSSLVSGFPLQQTETFLEWLLLPLIHFVLLAYLPLAGMRLFATAPGFAAGCGQFLMVRRDAYEASGGHANIRTTMHDGLLLPQLLRKRGYRTDLADLTRLATCRMYHSAAEVWNGLAKNATEGLAAPSRILIFSALLFFGQIAPLPLAFAVLLKPSFSTTTIRWLVLAAIVASFLPRLMAVVRFRQKPVSAVLHPIGIAALLSLQWYALFRKLSGRPAIWKQRGYHAN